MSLNFHECFLASDETWQAYTQLLVSLLSINRSGYSQADTGRGHACHVMLTQSALASLADLRYEKHRSRHPASGRQ